jgi:hypothetical protein
VRAGLAFCQYAVQAAGRGPIARRLGLGDHLRQRPDLREAWFSDFAHGTEDVAAYWHGSQPPQNGERHLDAVRHGMDLDHLPHG